MLRKLLPMRRRNLTQKARIGGQTVYYSAGLYEDGRLGEIFIDLSKQGAALRFWAGSTAQLFSLAVQYGCPLEKIVDAFVGAQSLPSGSVHGHSRITHCTSVLDYIVRSLAIEFLGREDLADVLPDAESERKVAGEHQRGSGV